MAIGPWGAYETRKGIGSLGEGVRMGVYGELIGQMTE